MESNYTSLELSRKLKEVGFEGESGYFWMDIHGMKVIPEAMILVLHDYTKTEPVYVAYDILNDICCKYAKEIFGEEEIDDWDGDSDTWVEDNEEPAYQYHSTKVLLLMQQRRKQKAEDYIWKHCLFDKLDNKEE